MGLRRDDAVWTRDEPDPRARERAGSLAEQWLGFLLAPAAFFAHLQIGYAMVSWTCTRHQEVWLHVVGVASVVVAAVGTWIASRVLARTRDDEAERAERAHGPDEARDAMGMLRRARFLAETGLGTSALLTLLLFAQWAAAFFSSPCQ